MISSSNENTVSEHMFCRWKDSNSSHKLPYTTLKQVFLEERINEEQLQYNIIYSIF